MILIVEEIDHLIIDHKEKLHFHKIFQYIMKKKYQKNMQYMDCRNLNMKELILHIKVKK